MATGDRVLRQSRGQGPSRGGRTGDPVIDGLWALGDAIDRSAKRKRIEAKEAAALERQRRQDQLAEERMQMQRDALLVEKAAREKKARADHIKARGEEAWSTHVADRLDDERIQMAIDDVPLEERLVRFGEWRDRLPGEMRELGYNDAEYQSMSKEFLDPYMNTLIPARIKDLEDQRVAEVALERKTAREDEADAMARGRYAMAVEKHGLEVTDKNLGIAIKKHRIAIQPEEDAERHRKYARGIRRGEIAEAGEERAQAGEERAQAGEGRAQRGEERELEEIERKRRKREQDQLNALTDARLQSHGEELWAPALTAYDSDPNASFPDLENRLKEIAQQLEADALQEGATDEAAERTALNFTRAQTGEMADRRKVWGEKQQRLRKEALVKEGNRAQRKIRGLLDALGTPNLPAGQQAEAMLGYEAMMETIKTGLEAQGLDSEAVATRMVEMERKHGLSIIKSSAATIYAIDPSGMQARAFQRNFDRRENDFFEMLVQDGTVERWEIQEVLDKAEERFNKKAEAEHQAQQRGIENDRIGQQRLVRIAMRQLRRDPDYSLQDFENDLVDQGVEGDILKAGSELARTLATNERDDFWRAVAESDGAKRMTVDLKGQIANAMTGQEVGRVLQNALDQLREENIAPDQWDDIETAGDSRLYQMGETRHEVLDDVNENFTNVIRKTITSQGGSWSRYATSPDVINQIMFIAGQASRKILATGGFYENELVVKKAFDRVGFSVRWGEGLARSMVNVEAGEELEIARVAAMQQADAFWMRVQQAPANLTPEQIIKANAPPSFLKDMDHMSYREGLIDVASTLQNINDSGDKPEVKMRKRKQIVMMTQVLNARDTPEEDYEVIAPEIEEAEGKTPTTGQKRAKRAMGGRQGRTTIVEGGGSGTSGGIGGLWDGITQRWRDNQMEN